MPANAAHFLTELSISFTPRVYLLPKIRRIRGSRKVVAQLGPFLDPHLLKSIFVFMTRRFDHSIELSLDQLIAPFDDQRRLLHRPPEALKKPLFSLGLQRGWSIFTYCVVCL